ncbi:hypothetical protein [Pseudofrankia inefficax]|uniref:Translation initiation factor IF-2 n=1 Tax=Pseudofrankia inefficax (strain DSM 45817 / CECT 9037 / DDB 130130 / EuI1c) TaxID=298654 RepID=E3J7M5_PSEI1|nr:hypothetical protein [Pseudofrankia inefficax]ADP79634.1 translation initiation factor IF-2 [Pseudofrankia inefficax]
MFPLHTEIALRLAQEHAAEERRRAARHRLAREARVGPGRLAALAGFLRQRGGRPPAGETPRPRTEPTLAPTPPGASAAGPVAPADHLVIQPIGRPRLPSAPSAEAGAQRVESRP